MKIVIFCGGHGSRLWPISRLSFPKPFVPFLKGESLFEMTYKRYRKEYPASDIFISTEDRYLKFVKACTCNKQVCIERADTKNCIV